MRVEFVKGVHQLMQEDPKALFISGDLGFNAFEGLRDSFPGRFINGGAAEQNIISIAAGMALEGFRPWVYSIAPFITYRCLEQIRNDVCLHNLPVRVAGNGGGYTYGIMGATHHTLEEVAALKVLPNMTVFMPCTNNHVESAVRQIGNLNGPSYLRLGYSGFQSNMPPLSENPKTLTRTYSTGSKCTVIGVGQGLQIALKALEEGLIPQDQVAVFGLAKFPFDFESDRVMIDHVMTTQNLIVIEEHYLYGSIAESLKMALPNIERFKVMTPFYSQDHTYGSPAFHLKQTNVTPQDLARLIKESVG